MLCRSKWTAFRQGLKYKELAYYCFMFVAANGFVKYGESKLAVGRDLCAIQSKLASRLKQTPVYSIKLIVFINPASAHRQNNPFFNSSFSSFFPRIFIIWFQNHIHLKSFKKPSRKGVCVSNTLLLLWNTMFTNKHVQQPTSADRSQNFFCCSWNLIRGPRMLLAYTISDPSGCYHNWTWKRLRRTCIGVCP